MTVVIKIGCITAYGNHRNTPERHVASLHSIDENRIVQKPSCKCQSDVKRIVAFVTDSRPLLFY